MGVPTDIFEEPMETNVGSSSKFLLSIFFTLFQTLKDDLYFFLNSLPKAKGRDEAIPKLLLAEEALRHRPGRVRDQSAGPRDDQTLGQEDHDDLHERHPPARRVPEPGSAQAAVLRLHVGRRQPDGSAGLHREENGMSEEEDDARQNVPAPLVLIEDNGVVKK